MTDLDLDSLGILESTDKSSLYWDYLRHYEEEFSRFRDRDINVIEIGVFRGASLKVWERYFTKATIVGIDIRPECARHAGGRRIVEVGSQIDAEFLARLTQKYPPTIVIDDGSHIADHVQFSFEALFPRLLPGGCYVIEDIAGYGPSAQYRGSTELHTPDYVLHIARRTMLRHATSDMSPALAAAVRDIDKMSLISSAAYFWKRRATDPAALIAAREVLVERSGTVLNWQGLCKLIVNNGGPLERAEAAARRAIELAPKNSESHHLLGIVLEKQGDLVGANASARTALGLRPADKGLQHRNDVLDKRLASAARLWGAGPA